MTQEKYLAMDVGGSSVKFAVLTGELEFLERGKLPVSTASKEDLFRTLKEIYSRYGEGTAAVPMSVPGIIDRFRGVTYTGGAFQVGS